MLMAPSDAILENLDLAGKRVLDVGCGEGLITRAMTEAGASVTGVDPNPQQIAMVLTLDPAGDEVYIKAPGEQLPFADESFDLVVYNNSLHHVPEEDIMPALDEAVRVLKRGGQLYIADGLAKGPITILKDIFQDEEHLRKIVANAVKIVAKKKLKKDKEFQYSRIIEHKDYEAFKNYTIRRGPHRANIFHQREDEIRQAFSKIAKPMNGGYGLEQYIRVNVMVKP